MIFYGTLDIIYLIAQSEFATHIPIMRMKVLSDEIMFDNFFWLILVN